MAKTAGRLGAVGVAAAGLLLLASPAGGHVAPDKEEVPAGAFTDVALTVGHGCEDSPTRQVSIQVPEAIVSVTPEVRPGWEIAVEEEQLDEPVGGEGEQVTERISTVTYTAASGNELPPHYRDTFTLGFQAPESPGEPLFFKTVQRCVEGEIAWIEEYTGEGEEPDNPAPVVMVTEAAADGHAHGDGEAEGESDGEERTTTPTEEEVAVDAEQAAAEGSGDDGDDSTGLAIAGLVVGGLGLATGGWALSRTRKAAAGTD
jgi:uncharacterized protein YcnI